MLGRVALAQMPTPAPAAPDGAAAEQVEIVARVPGAREKKTLAQLRAARQAFEQHHGLAPAAALAFRLYPRRDAQAFERLRLFLVVGDERRPVALDALQRFQLDPAWAGLDGDALLQTNLPDGDVAWKVDVRSPGLPDGERRLGDLRLECEADTFHGDLQRGLRTPASAILDAQGKLCQDDDAQAWFAEQPIFGVTLVAGARRQPLAYSYLHGSTGTMALAALFDWPYHLRDRTYFLPLEDTSWPDDTRVVLDAMDAPQPPLAHAP